METLSQGSRTSRKIGSQHKSAGPFTLAEIHKIVVSTESAIAAYTELRVLVKFSLSANGAKSVAVAGSFNDWNASKAPLRKTGDLWTTSLRLPRGRYQYRFVVDGKWVSDPSATESVANPFGGRNSVLSL